MNNKINIITPCSRIYNIPIIYSDMLCKLCMNIGIKWWIVLDDSLNKTDIQSVKTELNEEKDERIEIVFINSDKEKPIAGHAHRNIVLNILENENGIDKKQDEWIYNLDDDNIISDKLLDFISCEELSTYDGIIFSQINHDGSYRLIVDENKITVCNVDMGMFMFRRKILNHLRFLENDYCADGHFIEKMYENNKNKFFIIKEALCYYNYLQRDKKMEKQIEKQIDNNTNDKICPVQLLQSKWEFEVLLGLYGSIKPKNVLEIGSFYGGTLWHWLTYNDVIEKVVSIDFPIPRSDARYEEMIQSKSKWNEWLNKHEDLIFFSLENDSKDKRTIKKAETIFPNNDIDFLFIDGGHDYETVKSDFENYSKLVKTNGVIVLHDVVGLGEVRQYWEELKNDHHKYLEICEDRSVGWGIGIIIKS